MHHFSYAGGLLHAEDVNLRTLATEVGTPFYCYSTATLERHYSVFAGAFADVPALVCYAMKANSNQAVLRTLARLGAGMDVVSEGELRRARAAGVPGSRITFSGVGKTAAEMAHGPARIVVNCAGIAPAKRTVSKKRDTGEFVAHDAATFAKVLAVNLGGTFTVLSKAAARMAGLDPVTPDGGRGVIICTASVAAQDGQIGQAAYAASKAGVLGLTLPVARDLSGFGIRVVTILPGLFYTPMFESVPDDARKALEVSVPFPSRLGRPDEYAALVRSIVENDMLNGTGIRLDGALRMAPR
jgi:NAD(P)-dependent dehydrogenase (short-subunit alcohol dehydrogenase family)